MSEDWPSAFAATEAQWSSEKGSASSKMEAWRKQKLLLQHATRNLDRTVQCAVLKEHHDKMEKAGNTESYLQERVLNCQQLLKQSRRKGGGSPRMPMQWAMPEASAFEPPCRGLNESCNQNEISDDELKRLRQYAEPSILPSSSKPALPASACVSAHPEPPPNAFRTAREEQLLRELQKNKPTGGGGAAALDFSNLMDYSKKSLGTRRGVRAKFVPPVARNNNNNNNAVGGALSLSDYATVGKGGQAAAVPAQEAAIECPALAGLDAKMVADIKSGIMAKLKPVAWEDIAGLEYAKSVIEEAVVLPMVRPELFKGLRRPCRAILLFGPPGTGKTLIGKCIASQSGATFFSINPSTLTSKWVGESEKLVKTLFAVAAAHQPAVIFMDEIDSLLSQRTGKENDSARCLKTEFFIHLDGAATNEDDRILLVGATNRPQELDEAARRRFVRRLYIPLPELEARKAIITRLIRQVSNDLSEEQITEIARQTEGYSGADIDSLCREAAMAPIRDIRLTVRTANEEQVREVRAGDFEAALRVVTASVSLEETEQYIAWNNIYGVKS